MYTEGGRPAVEAGTGMELGMLVEQVQEVELFGGEWRDGLLFLCMSWSKKRENLSILITTQIFDESQSTIIWSHLSQCRPPPL